MEGRKEFCFPVNHQISLGVEEEKKKRRKENWVERKKGSS
jgi:hypothetical protein